MLASRRRGNDEVAERGAGRQDAVVGHQVSAWRWDQCRNMRPSRSNRLIR
jgi:hypothetical protein